MEKDILVFKFNFQCKGGILLYNTSYTTCDVLNPINIEVDKKCKKMSERNRNTTNK